ncbi:MAG TPA: retropepsin-like aspartic protease [Steroidobacteraceae bacterium]|nr:retropepsin-like aspartic protease [Steroidobacteraceae bacterium]
MTRVLLALILACQVSAALAAQAPAVTLSVRADRLFLPVEVNGRSTEALLDSAAESSVIDPSFAGELRLHLSGQATARGSGGEQQAQFARVSVRVASVQLGELTVAVVDLADVSRRLVGAPVRFILGRELFDTARLRIDVDGGSLQVLSRSAPVRGTGVPLTEHAGIESIPARVEGIAAAADFDLGNGSDVLIGKAFAERHGLLQPGRVVASRRGGGIGGETDRQVIRLRTLEVGGARFDDVDAQVDSLSNAGELNLGVKILRRFVIVTDFAQRRIWLEPRPLP